MKFQFVDKKLEVSEALREYARKKISKLDKYFKQEGDAQVTFHVESSRHTVEVTVHSGTMIIRARETTSDMYASIDSAVAAMERQIHKNKTRLEKRLHQRAFDKGEAPVAMADFSVEEERDFHIIRTKRFSLKPMTAEEAILQMNLLGHEFYVFRNFDNGGAFSVVYRRNDGGYGLIEEG